MKTARARGQERMLGWMLVSVAIGWFAREPGGLINEALAYYEPTWAWGVIWIAMGLAVVLGSLFTNRSLRYLLLSVMLVLWLLLLFSLRFALHPLIGFCVIGAWYSGMLLIEHAFRITR